MSMIQVVPRDWCYSVVKDTTGQKTPRDSLPTGWTKCKRFPTEIHDELRASGHIPDWNKGRNEHLIQWVAKCSWVFRAQIDIDVDRLDDGFQAELVFEGIDTFGTVKLNGHHILDADNHFRTWRVPVGKDLLQATNELVLEFKPPLDVALAVEKEHGPFRGGSCNLGDRARIGIRKTQYHARWDWGPELWCIGIDRPVYLQLYKTRIKSLDTAARVDASLSTSLDIRIKADGRPSYAQVTVSGPDGKELINERLTDMKGNWNINFDLWWPVNEGPQNLYAVVVDLYENDQVVDSCTRNIGFRRAELVQSPLDGQPGSSFFFRINNRPVFVGGSNWIPIDMVLSSGTPDRYERWLDLMVEGNQNMVRVWGGGVFEPDCFYEMCDRKGLLVWQDFMFACGVYPVFPKFLASVEAEARDNIERLRHHPALVMLCGNNEDYQQITQWDMDQDGDPLPARVVYEKLLPRLIEELVDPAIPYWPGSPYGGKGWDTSDPTTGDVHQWDVWAGKEHNYLDWDRLGGRFVSEFGLPCLPDRRTVDYWLDQDDSQAYPQSKSMQQHNKAGSYERRFAGLMNENFRLTGDLDEYIFRNQLMQSEGVGEAYRTWRRQWKGPGREYCGGVLVWQINDCWPVTSWAIVDYFLRPKPAYFTVSRALQSIGLGILRTVEKNREHDRPRQYYEYGAFQSATARAEVWCSNGTQEQTVQFQLQAIDLVTGWSQNIVSRQVVLGENRSTEIWSGEIPGPDKEDAFDSFAPTGTIVLHAAVTRQNGEVTMYDDWPQPYKFLDLPDPGIKIDVHEDKVVLRCEKPAKGVWLDVDGADDGVVWGDNSIDMCPGEVYHVGVKGSRGKRVTYRSLGWEKPRIADRTCQFM